jgi:hypothetical protein
VVQVFAVIGGALKLLISAVDMDDDQQQEMDEEDVVEAQYVGVFCTNSYYSCKQAFSLARLVTARLTRYSTAIG